MRFERLSDINSSKFLTAMDLYWSCVPLKKQREYQSQCAIMGEPDYRFELLYDGEDFVGLLLCWEREDFIYVEHLYILHEKRGKSYGAEAMGMLKGEGKTIILETDPPINRTKTFFERCGFMENDFEHIHQSYHAMFPGNRLVVMTYPDCLSEGKYKDFCRYLDDVVMAQ